MTVHIHAWLEEREIHGLDRAFRGRLTSEAIEKPVGVASVSELHAALDRILGVAGLTEERQPGAQP